MTFSHNDLCVLGAKWLRSGSLHNCKSVMIECGSFSERPDVIGFRYNTAPYGSVLLEAKTSRSDFLSDKKKKHKLHGEGMGKWRYYICPKGILCAEDMPDGWGLLHVSDSGRIKVIKGVFEDKSSYTRIKDDYERYAFDKFDIHLEHRLLAINLQGMMYNEDNGLDLREMSKRYRKLEIELNEANMSAEAAKRELLLAKQREKALLSKLSMLGVSEREALYPATMPRRQKA